ncbi:MAG: hypothetical protein QOG10_3250 [Kribbellaceae bacterium]|jgi:hypothetical protein|nr:hypothetical protein [Kribbellaceae bacterium]
MSEPNSPAVVPGPLQRLVHVAQSRQARRIPCPASRGPVGREPFRAANRPARLATPGRLIRGQQFHRASTSQPRDLEPDRRQPGGTVLGGSRVGLRYRMSRGGRQDDPTVLLGVVEEPRRPHPEPASEAGLDRQDQPPTAPRLPAQKKACGTCSKLKGDQGKQPSTAGWPGPNAAASPRSSNSAAPVWTVTSPCALRRGALTTPG